MVRTETNSQTINNLYKKNVNPNNDIFEGDQINISSLFQRGDEELGVWDKKRKEGYIDSLQKNYPTGIITFVKDYSIATAYQDKWVTLDGGNRFRAIRDYIDNKFKVDGTLYSDLEPELKARFDNILVPCQWLSIERLDPDETIAQMFTRLNTTSKPLSQGELLKAHGWKSNIFEIELAKAIIGDFWTSKFDDTNLFEGFEDKIIDLQHKWKNCFGQLKETKRYDALAMIVGYIVSAKTSEFNNFDKRYERIKGYLEKNELTKSQIIKIINKLLNMINIVDKLESNKTILGKFTKGLPSQSKISTIWYLICEEKINDLFEKKIIWFYNEISDSEELRNEYSNIMEKSGNNETSKSKILKSIEFIESNTEHITR